MLQKNENIVDLLFSEIEKRGGSVPKFSIETGIPKDRVYKWRQQGTVPKAEDEKKILQWLKLDKVPHEMEVKHDITAATLLNLAESNKLLAESNKALARSHEELVMMLKATANDPQQIPEAVEARLSDLLVLLAEVGSGKRWHTPQEAVAALSKQFFGRKAKS